MSPYQKLAATPYPCAPLQRQIVSRTGPQQNKCSRRRRRRASRTTPPQGTQRERGDLLHPMAAGTIECLALCLAPCGQKPFQCRGDLLRAPDGFMRIAASAGHAATCEGVLPDLPQLRKLQKNALAQPLHPARNLFGLDPRKAQSLRSCCEIARLRRGAQLHGICHRGTSRDVCGQLEKLLHCRRRSQARAEVVASGRCTNGRGHLPRDQAAQHDDRHGAPQPRMAGDGTEALVPFYSQPPFSSPAGLDFVVWPVYTPDPAKRYAAVGVGTIEPARTSAACSRRRSSRSYPVRNMSRSRRRARHKT